MRNKKMMVLVLLLTLAILLTGCDGRTGSAGRGNADTATATVAVDHYGPKNTAADTLEATLTNSEYTSGVTLNWSDKVATESKSTLAGLQQITFVIDGDEKISSWGKERKLDSIKLEFTNQTSGDKVSLSTSLIGKASNLLADSHYFKVDGNTFYFYPHYFSEGEVITLKATFTYKGEGWLDKVLSSKTTEGFWLFTVGQPTDETFDGVFDGVSESVGGFIDDTVDKITGNVDSSEEADTADTVEYLPVRYHIEGIEGDFTVARYQEEALKNAVTLPGKTASITFFTQEEGRNITKMYLCPAGEEASTEKLAWSNEWYADNCHKFENLDLSQYSGSTLTFRVEFLEGSEWNPLKDHIFTFITVNVP